MRSDEPNWDSLTVEVLLLLKQSPISLAQADIVGALMKGGFAGPVDESRMSRALRTLIQAHEIAESNRDGVVRYQSMLHAQMDRTFIVFD